MLNRRPLISFLILIAGLLYLTLPPGNRYGEMTAEIRRLHRAGLYTDAIRVAERLVEAREKIYDLDDPTLANSLSDLALMYQEQGQFGQAEPRLLRALALTEKSKGPAHPWVGTMLNNLGLLAQAQGRDIEAERFLRRSLAIRENALGPTHLDVGQTISNLGLLYTSIGRYEEAEVLLKRGLEIRVKALGPAHPEAGQSLNNLASLYLAQGRLEDAEPLFKRSHATLEKALGPDHPNVGTVLLSLTSLYLQQGRSLETESVSERALAALEKALGDTHLLVGQAIHHRGSLKAFQGALDQAQALIDKSVSILVAAHGPNHPSVITAIGDLGSVAMAQGDFSRASDLFSRAASALEWRDEKGLIGLPVRVDQGELKRSGWVFDGLVKATYRLAAQSAHDRSSWATRMFMSAQLGADSNAARSIHQMAARSAAQSPSLATMVRERQDLIAEWEAKDKQLIILKSKLAHERHTQAESKLGFEMWAIERRRLRVDEALSRDFPDHANLARPKPVSVAEIQAVLDDREALVFFLATGAGLGPLPEETFIWVVTKRELRWLRSEVGTNTLAREVTALRCGLDTTAWGSAASACRELTGTSYTDEDFAAGRPPHFDARRAHSLYRNLFAGAEDLIKGKHLLIVPTAALTTLPFQVLVTRPPSSPDLALTSWLIRDHAITVLPSVSSLTSLRSIAKSSAATKPMLGFGNPTLDGDQNHSQLAATFRKLAASARAQTHCVAAPAARTVSRRSPSRNVDSALQPGGRADLEHLRRQTPLPETADELCDVARSVGADLREVRLGARATEREVKRLSASGELAQFRIIHFATHGVLSGQLSGLREPGLILTPPATATEEDDGYLSGSEIAGLKLDADWVILSACNTAGGADQGAAAEALSGLARVFFYSGARAVLVSHWEVDSAAASKIIKGAVHELIEGRSVGRAEALRQSMIAAMVDPSRSTNWIPASHPSVWAPFIVVGEGGANRR